MSDDRQEVRRGWGVFAPDDLWSVLGWALLTTFMRLMNPEVGLATASTLVSGMLAVFWVANANVRARVGAPNARVLFWALATAASFGVGSLL